MVMEQKHSKMVICMMVIRKIICPTMVMSSTPIRMVMCMKVNGNIVRGKGYAR